MAYNQFTGTHPNPATDDGQDACDYTRYDLLGLRDAIVGGWGPIPDWDITVNIGSGTAEEPDNIMYSKGTERIVVALNWGTSGGGDGNVIDAAISYSPNATDYDTVGNLDISYDANGNVTALGWS